MATTAVKKGNQDFLENYALKLLVPMMVQFYVTSVKHRSTSNQTIFSILNINF